MADEALATPGTSAVVEEFACLSVEVPSVSGQETCEQGREHHPEAVDPSVWRKLPQELVVLVFAKLPLLQIIRLCNCSKAWAAMSKSCKFAQACLEAHRRLFGLLGWTLVYEAAYTAVLYIRSKEWTGIVYLASPYDDKSGGVQGPFIDGDGHSNDDEYQDSLIVGDGGLVCFVPHYQEERSSVDTWVRISDIRMAEYERGINPGFFLLFDILRLLEGGCRVSVGRWDVSFNDEGRMLMPNRASSQQQLPAMSMRGCRFLLPLCFLSLLAASGVVADGNVTLQSLTIFNTHEWFGQKPDVYFRCQGEEKVDLPDINAKGQLYKFLGEESWQPLTTLVGKKCKRCGIFEKDTLKSDDVFDQWELCPLDFSPSPDGVYSRFKEKEFNLTLLCPLCNVVKSAEVTASEPVSEPAGEPAEKEKSNIHGLTVVIVVFVLLSLGGFAFVAYSLWRRKQREVQQARFIKLFEDDDFLDDELGLKDGL